MSETLTLPENETIENAVAETPVDDGQQVDAQEPIEQSNEPAWTPAEEAKARTYGWIDEEKYDGRGEWSNPRDFIKKVENDVAPMLKVALKNQDKSINELKQQLKQFQDYHVGSLKKAQEEAYEKAKAELRAKQEEAVENADTEAFHKLRQEEEKLAEKYKSPQDLLPPPPQQDPVLQNFIQRNPWVADQNKARTADRIYDEVVAQYPGLSREQALQEVERRVEIIYPEIGNYKKATGRNGAAPSMHGGSANVRSKGIKAKKTFDNLPKEAKDIYFQYIKDSDAHVDPENYASAYEW